MPAKNKPFVVYLDDTGKQQLEDLRKYYSERQGDVIISDGRIGRDLINEKHTEIVNKQNNNARITNIVEGLAEVKDELRALRSEGSQNNQRLTALEDKFDRLVILLMEEKSNVQPRN